MSLRFAELRRRLLSIDGCDIKIPHLSLSLEYAEMMWSNDSRSVFEKFKTHIFPSLLYRTLVLRRRRFNFAHILRSKHMNDAEVKKKVLGMLFTEREDYEFCKACAKQIMACSVALLICFLPLSKTHTSIEHIVAEVMKNTINDFDESLLFEIDRTSRLKEFVESAKKDIQRLQLSRDDQQTIKKNDDILNNILSMHRMYLINLKCYKMTSVMSRVFWSVIHCTHAGNSLKRLKKQFEADFKADDEQLEKAMLCVVYCIDENIRRFHLPKLDDLKIWNIDRILDKNTPNVIVHLSILIDALQLWDKESLFMPPSEIDLGTTSGLICSLSIEVMTFDLCEGIKSENRNDSKANKKVLKDAFIELYKHTGLFTEMVKMGEFHAALGHHQAFMDGPLSVVSSALQDGTIKIQSFGMWFWEILQTGRTVS